MPRNRIEAGQAFVKINLDSREFNSGLTGLERRLRQTGRTVAGVGASFLAIGAASATGIASTVNAFRGLDDTLRRTSVLLGGIEGNYASLANQANELGGSTRFSAREVANLQRVLAQAGFQLPDISILTRDILDFATAADVSLPDAAANLISTLNQFEISANNSQQVVDSIVEASTLANLTVSQIIESLRTAAPAANARGETLAETLANIVALAEANITGGEAGTSLRNSLLRTADIGELEIRFGVNLRDGNGEVLNLNRTLSEIRRSLAALPDEEVNVILQETFGVEGFTGASILSSVDNFDVLRTAIANATGTAREFSDVLSGGIGGNIDTAFSRLQQTVETLGQAFAPAAAVFLNAVSSIASFVTNLAERFPVLATGTALVTAGMLTLSTILVGVSVALGVIARAITLTQSGYALLKRSTDSATTSTEANVDAIKRNTAETNKNNAAIKAAIALKNAQIRVNDAANRIRPVSSVSTNNRTPSFNVFDADNNSNTQNLFVAGPDGTQLVQRNRSITQSTDGLNRLDDATRRMDNSASRLNVQLGRKRINLDAITNGLGRATQSTRLFALRGVGSILNALPGILTGLPFVATALLAVGNAANQTFAFFNGGRDLFGVDQIERSLPILTRIGRVLAAIGINNRFNIAADIREATESYRLAAANLSSAERLLDTASDPTERISALTGLTNALRRQLEETEKLNAAESQSGDLTSAQIARQTRLAERIEATNNEIVRQQRLLTQSFANPLNDSQRDGVRSTLSSVGANRSEVEALRAQVPVELLVDQVGAERSLEASLDRLNQIVNADRISNQTRFTLLSDLTAAEQDIQRFRLEQSRPDATIESTAIATLNLESVTRIRDQIRAILEGAFAVDTSAPRDLSNLFVAGLENSLNRISSISSDFQTPDLFAIGNLTQAEGVLGELLERSRELRAQGTVEFDQIVELGDIDRRTAELREFFAALLANQNQDPRVTSFASDVLRELEVVDARINQIFSTRLPDIAPRLAGQNQFEIFFGQLTDFSQDILQARTELNNALQDFVGTDAENSVRRIRQEAQRLIADLREAGTLTDDQEQRIRLQVQADIDDLAVREFLNLVNENNRVAQDLVNEQRANEFESARAIVRASGVDVQRRLAAIDQAQIQADREAQERVNALDQEEINRIRGEITVQGASNVSLAERQLVGPQNRDEVFLLKQQNTILNRIAENTETQGRFVP